MVWILKDQYQGFAYGLLSTSVILCLCVSSYFLLDLYLSSEKSSMGHNLLVEMIYSFGIAITAPSL